MRKILSAMSLVVSACPAIADPPATCGEFAGHMMKQGSVDGDFIGMADKFTALGIGMVAGATIASGAASQNQQEAEKAFFQGVYKRCVASPDTLLADAIREQVRSSK